MGARPLATSRPRRLQSTRRKYSWRGKDMKERESVSMPMKRESKTGVGERVHLPFDPFLLVEKPPRTAELQLARDRTILKIADDGGEDVIVRRVDVVDDGSGQRMLLLQQVEVGAQGGGLLPSRRRCRSRCRGRPRGRGANSRCGAHPDEAAWSSLSRRRGDRKTT